MKRLSLAQNVRFVLLIGFLLMFSSGCVSLFLMGEHFNVDRNYKEFIGIKVATKITPAAILMERSTPYIQMHYDKPHGLVYKANVPKGTIITVTHVLREYILSGDDVFDRVWGEIDVPGYKGPVMVGVCDGKKHEDIYHCIESDKYEILGK